MKFREVLESACARVTAKADISREVNISCVRFLREKLNCGQSLSQSLSQHLKLLPQKPLADGSLSSALCALSQHQSSLAARIAALSAVDEQ